MNILDDAGVLVGRGGSICEEVAYLSLIFGLQSGDSSC